MNSVNLALATMAASVAFALPTEIANRQNARPREQSQYINDTTVNIH